MRYSIRLNNATPIPQRRMTPIALAAANDNALEVLRILLARGANPNTVSDPLKMSVLSIACWRASVKSIRALLRAGADPFPVDSLGRT